MEKVLESTEEFDVELFDRIIECFYNPKSTDHKRAEEVLLRFRDHPDSWARTAAVLKESKDEKSKVFALQALERMVKIRWTLLSPQQQEGVREYVIEGILENAVDSTNKLTKYFNQVLIEIIKREWPEKWPTLIPDLLGASKSEQLVCINTFDILRILCDEIFNFPKSMTIHRNLALKDQMSREFPGVFDLVLTILDKVSIGEITVPPELINSSLSLLFVVVPVLPVEYLLQVNLSGIVNRYIDTEFNRKSLGVLRKIVEREVEDTEGHLAVIKGSFIAVSAFIEKYFRSFNEIHRGKLRVHYNSLSDKDVQLLREVVLFFSSTYKYCKELESLGCNTSAPLAPLLDITEVNDFEMFRLCTEFWNAFVKSLFLEFPFAPPPVKQPVGLRRARYLEDLERLSRVLIQQMARPQEVTITENEDGEIVLEKLSETEHIVHHKEMRETLFNISAMVPGGLGPYIESELKKLNEGQWSRDRLNKNIWAYAAITGSSSQEKEKTLLLHIIKNLLSLCAGKSSIADRAVIASCVLYIVSQNPEFLRKTWTFCKIVLEKIFEFMVEVQIEGIVDMACDIFLALMSSSAGYEVCLVHNDQKRPYIEDILESLPVHVRILQSYQLERVYEGLCCVVFGRVDKLLAYPLQDVYSVQMDSPESIQRVIQAIRLIKVICSAKSEEEFSRVREKTLEESFPAIHRIFDSILQMGQGHAALNRYLAILKKEILKLYSTIAREFSIGFIHGGFMNVCSQVILLPLSMSVEFTPEPLELLADLCKRTVEGTTPLVEAVGAPVAKVVLSNPSNQEELTKAFYKMLCSAMKTQTQSNSIEILEWLAFGASHPDREIAEQCIEVIAKVIERSSIEVIRLRYFDLFECIVGAALDKDHEGSIDSLLVSLSILIRYSIEERCPTQMQVLEVFGGRLHQIFPHLQPSDIEEFIYRFYSNINSHEELTNAFNDFQVKMRTI